MTDHRTRIPGTHWPGTVPIQPWQPGQAATPVSGPVPAPAEDMTQLAERVRALLDVEAGRDAWVQLGGRLFDVVISSAGPEGYAAVDLMDEIQRDAGGCGPVVDDTELGWLWWLVPPGTAAVWPVHTHGVCIGAPCSITLPPLERRRPPDRHWRRPAAGDRLVPPRPLAKVLRQFRPEPTPHAQLTKQLRLYC